MRTQSLSFWEGVSSFANVIAVLMGVTAATTTFLSPIVAAIAGAMVAVLVFVAWCASRKASGIRLRESNERIATAEQKASEANEKAEQERLARLRIEERLAPRSLSQTNNLSDKLRQFESTEITIVRPFESGLDAVRLEHQIVSTLKEAGWIVNTVEANAPPDGYFEGVVVVTSPEAEHEVAAAVNSLINELNANGVVTTKGSAPKDAPDKIRMIIGTRP